MKMMAEMLGVFAIMTKEMEQGRASESIPDDTFSVTDRDLETHGKKFLQGLMGKKGRIEAALIRMDELTDKGVVEVITQHRSSFDQLKQRVEGAREEVKHRSPLDRLERGLEGAMEEVKRLDVKVDQLIEGTFIMSATLKWHFKPTYN